MACCRVNFTFDLLSFANKEQETRLTLQEHDDDDGGDDLLPITFFANLMCASYSKGPVEFWDVLTWSFLYHLYVQLE